MLPKEGTIVSMEQLINRAWASYRMPRRVRNGQLDKQSRILSLSWNGKTARMTGGLYGCHTVETTDPTAVRAHWHGYVSNNRGRDTKPAIEFTSTEVKPLERGAK